MKITKSEVIRTEMVMDTLLISNDEWTVKRKE